MRQKTAAVVGNFNLGECFCEVACRHGHPTRVFNIGRGHWVTCDTCRTCMFLGSNLMSGWRKEDERTWRMNHDSVKGYAVVE